MNRLLTGNFDDYGFPYLTVGIAKQHTCNQIITKAIIDTGAAHCLLQLDLIKALQLEPFRDTKYLHPQNGLLDSKDYFVDLYINTNNSDSAARIESVRVGVIYDQGYPAGMIIGVEFLKNTCFSYNGHEKTFEMKMKF